MNKNLRNISLTLISTLMLSISTAQAQSVTISSMFTNAQSSFTALITLVQFSAYLIGLFLVFGSIFKFSQLGSNPQLSAKAPIAMFFAGIGIFALTGTISIMTATLAMGSGPGTILLSTTSTLNSTMAAAMTSVLTFIRLIGYIAFIRGWLMINQAGQGKDGLIWRGLTHIGGGVAAINVTVFAKILANTFAPGLTMPF